MTADRLNAGNCLRNTVLFGSACFLMVLANLMAVLGGFFYETAACTMFAANLVLNAAVLFDICKNIRRDFPLLVFVGSFDLLLLGRVYVAFLSDYQDILYDLEATDFPNLFRALQIVTFAFLCVYAAYRLASPLFFKREKAVREKGLASVRQKPFVPVIRQISVAVLLVSSVASFYTLAQSILYVLKNGYLGSFTQAVDKVSIPSYISRLSLLFEPSFAVFLATLPDRRQLKLPLAVYGVYMLASLLTGRRNIFVCEALMLVIYFVLRDNLLPKGRRVLTKKTIAWTIVVGIILMYFLELVAELRLGQSATQRGFFSSLVNFVYSQGASFRVVIQTVNNWDLFNHQTSYQFLFYPFEQYAHNNVLTRTIFGFSPIIETQNMAFALTTHNFAHALTFLVDPARYLSGGGFGTSFVAEAYVAYGMAGVGIVSAGIGFLLRSFSSLLTRSWVFVALGLIALKDLVYISRNFALSWVTDTFNVTYICYFIGVYLMALLLAEIGSHVRKADSDSERLEMEKIP
ncbi:MAG: O-antigen polysaccharide polymerase Wzy family protein [Oscillospiraceae bacterium]|jgi:oligosaccharide repeat unit polymerase|nr:O-antigen polysaccharide polymerase Wzy family protein [Oscillospiraceae bacterium]MCI2036108.1 O-antigen polysaccharide polymerase Wzy family protein [Oscillospiraceae bacterium]